MNEAGQITSGLYTDWAEIQRVLAIKRGEGWAEQLPEELHLTHVDGVTRIKVGDDLFYTRNPATGQVYESRIEEKTVLVSVFDPDGELAEASTVPLDKFKAFRIDGQTP